MVFTRFFGTHRLTDSLTDGHTEKQYALAPKVFDGGGIETKIII